MSGILSNVEFAKHKFRDHCSWVNKPEMEQFVKAHILPNHTMKEIKKHSKQELCKIIYDWVTKPRPKPLPIMQYFTSETSDSDESEEELARPLSPILKLKAPSPVKSSYSSPIQHLTNKMSNLTFHTQPKITFAPVSPAKRVSPVSPAKVSPAKVSPVSPAKVSLSAKLQSPIKASSPRKALRWATPSQLEKVHTYNYNMSPSQSSYEHSPVRLSQSLASLSLQQRSHEDDDEWDHDPYDLQRLLNVDFDFDSQETRQWSPIHETSIYNVDDTWFDKIDKYDQ